jgi:hypothetical protein
MATPPSSASAERLRAIHRFDGWHVPISLGWFSDGYDPPVINKTAFHWYAFAIPKRGPHVSDHYLICDYLQMRHWTLAFTAPRTTPTATTPPGVLTCGCTRETRPAIPLGR